jgi:hypothetical protein
MSMKSLCHEPSAFSFVVYLHSSSQPNLLPNPSQSFFEAMTSNFVILHQAAGASFSDVTQYEPNTAVYTYVASAASIALSILEHPTCRQRLTDLALKLDNDRDTGTRFGNNPSRARSCVDLFLAKIRAHFPMILINDTMTNPAALGYHPRGDWDGDYHAFNPRNQSINMNGQVSYHCFPESI